ncbi:MAG: DUF120 domain-containing protein [Candidatus Woesearchaeota archaeon]
MPCKIFGRTAFILRPDYRKEAIIKKPKTIIEIACDVHLRKTFNIKDGDEVTVEI